MHMLQSLCWTWNCAIHLASVCFGSAKFHLNNGRNITRCPAILRTLSDKHNIEGKLDICHQCYVSLVFITSCLLWSVATVAVSYSNTAPHKYVQFTQRIHLCTMPTFHIWMFNILKLFLAFSNEPHIRLLTSDQYCPQKCLAYVPLNWTCPLYVSG